jgi:hypothetical protein
MTQSATQSQPAIPVGLRLGQVIGQAQSVLSGLLAGVLEQTQTKNETYQALQRMALLGGEASREGYISDLSDWLDLNPGDAGELADSLIAAGLLTAADETIRLADAGAQLRARIIGSLGAINAPLWESFDEADLETSIATLRELTLRARALSSAPAAPGAEEGRS